MPLTVNGGTFDLNGIANTIGVLNGNSAGNITNSGANQTLTIKDNGISGTYAGRDHPGRPTLILTKSTGTGTLTLTNAGSTYTGGTNINAGTISINADAGLGPSGTVALSGGTLLVTGTTTSSRTIRLSSGGTINVGFGVSYTISNAMTGQPLTKVGAGTLILGGNNTDSGGTNINSGTISVSNDHGALNVWRRHAGKLPAAMRPPPAASPSAPAAGPSTSPPTRPSRSAVPAASWPAAAGRWALSLKSTLAVTGGNSTVGSLTGAGNLSLGNKNITLGLDGSNQTYSGVISGTGSLTMTTGSGTQTLSGNNTYSGGTTINSGKLLATNTTGSATGGGTVTVNSGGTLGGTGAVGAIRAQDGGVVSPGLSPGRLTATAADLTQGVTTGGNLYLEINDSAADLLQLGSGTLTLDGTSVLTVDLNGLSAPPVTEPVPVVAGNVTGFDSFDLTNLQVVSNAHNLVVTPSANSSGLFLQIKASTSTTVTSLANPSVFGQPVTFTAVVANTSGTGILPAGTVTFSDGSTSLGTGVVTAARPRPSDQQPDGGHHTITAAYGGDSNFSGSTSGCLTQTFSRTHYLSPRSHRPPRASRRSSTVLNLGTASTPILNLYDNSTGTLGPADVTLVGTTTGAIRGSLVVDAVAGRSGSDGATRITFIQTGQSGVLGSAAPGTLFGVLPNDTYTVTLRSASNGFQDTNGNLLDGNADGTPGDDYVTTFVVNNSSNSVTVTLPDFSRGAGQLVNVPNTAAANDTFTNGLPLRLYNGINFTGSTASGNATVQVLTTAGLQVGDTVTGPGIPSGTTISATVSSDGTPTITLSQAATATSAALDNGGVVLNDSSGNQTITSVSLTLKYDPSLLNVTNYSITTSLGDPADSSVTTFDTSTAGLVNITFTTSTGIVLGPGGAQAFLTLQSNVPSTAYYAAKEILDLQNIDINNGSFTSGNGTGYRRRRHPCFRLPGRRYLR